jgi:hypothetical protein
MALLYDDTTLRLLDAFDKAGVTARLDSKHPDEHIEFLGSLGERLSGAMQTVSNSSNLIGVSPPDLVFAGLDPFVRWPIGTPVIVLDDAAPTVNRMAGSVSVAADAGSVTLNITAIEGGGTKTAWTLVALSTFLTGVATPVTEAQGGTAASTFSGARANMQLVRRYPVLSIESTPPGSPLSGDIHLVGEAPTGVYVTHEDDITTFSGTIWTFETPVEDSLVYDFKELEYYLFIDTATAGSIFLNSKWQALSRANQPWRQTTISILTLLTIEAIGPNKILVLDGLTDNLVITLPTASTARIGNVARFFREDASAFTVTINVTGGGFINGVATMTMNTQYDARTVCVTDSTSWSIVSK